MSLGSILLAMVFGSDDGAGPASSQEGAVSASEGHQQQTPVPFSRGAQTHTAFRSHYQHAGLECGTAAAGAIAGSGGGQESGQIGRRRHR